MTIVIVLLEYISISIDTAILTAYTNVSISLVHH